MTAIADAICCTYCGPILQSELQHQSRNTEIFSILAVSGWYRWLNVTPLFQSFYSFIHSYSIRITKVGKLQLNTWG